MTAADKLRELLATRPTGAILDDLLRWWASADLVAEVLMELRDREIVVEDRGNSFKRVSAELAKLQTAAPVMITAMALAADEGEAEDLIKIVLWYENEEPDHIAVWLDAERARTARASDRVAALLNGEQP